MKDKPLTVARHDYMQTMVDATNNSNLPAFVIVEVLENLLREMRPMMDAELKRDLASYRASMQESHIEGGKSDGEQEDK